MARPSFIRTASHQLITSGALHTPGLGGTRVSTSGDRIAGTIRTICVNVQRWRRSLHHLLRDHHFLDAFKAGSSNMVSSRMISRIERRPRAPVLRSIAFLEIAESASSESVRSTFSISNNRRYCFTNAFFGSSRTRLSAGSSRSSRVASTGRRPTNSGIRPNFNRSSGSTWRKISPVLRSSGPATLAAKPIDVARPRAEMILSSPEKAPPQTNKMFVVLICRTPPGFLPDRSRRLLARAGFVSPSLDGGCYSSCLAEPALELRQPRLQRRILGLKGRDQREQVFQRRRTRRFASYPMLESEPASAVERIFSSNPAAA